MLRNETISKLKDLRLLGFFEAWEQQERDESYQTMSFEERLGLLVDWEYSKRQHNKLLRLIRQARFQNHTACVEDIKYSPDRKLDRNFLLELAACNYIPHAKNILIAGATGAGNYAK